MISFVLLGSAAGGYAVGNIAEKTYDRGFP